MPSLHHLAQAHMRLFLKSGCDGTLHVYSKKKGYMKKRPLRKIARLQDPHPTEVEQTMSKIESRAALALRDLAREDNTQGKLMPGRNTDLLIYMALAASRHPDCIADFRRQIYEQAKRHPDFLQHWREMLSDGILFDAVFNQVLPAVARPLGELQWVTMRLPKNTPEHFVISDNPVAIAYAGTFGVPNQHTLVAMPVSKELLLIGCTCPPRIREIIRDPRQVNAMMLARCREYIYSSEKLDYEELARWAEKIHLGQALWASRQPVELQFWTPRGLVPVSSGW